MLFGQKHVERYRETDGEEGHDWQGTTTLLLTTTGRRSGETRTTPLIYQRFGDDYLVVASNGGSDGHPPGTSTCELIPTPRSRSRPTASRPALARPRRTKPDMWRTMTAAWAPYDDYQQKTDREIPVVVLERAEDD